MTLEAQAGEMTAIAAMTGTVHLLLVTTVMADINNNTRATEVEIVAALMEEEVTEDQEVVTEVATVAGATTATEVATTGTTMMMMKMTATKAAGDSPKLLRAVLIKETHKEPVTLPNTLESEEEEVANRVGILTVNVLKLLPKRTTGKNKAVSRKEAIANNSRPTRSKPKKAQAQSS